MAAFLTLLGPLLEKLALWIYERAVTNYKSTALGAAIGSAVYGTLTIFGCNGDLIQTAVVSAIVALPKVLDSDPDKIAPTLWQAIQDGVAQKKKSDQVMADAVALQEQAKKDAGMQ